MVQVLNFEDHTLLFFTETRISADLDESSLKMCYQLQKLLITLIHQWYL